MRIVDLDLTNESAIQQVAAMLVESFATNWPEAWPDMESAQEGVRESFAADRISRIALDQDGTVLGWVGGISQYRGHVWELHPLVVRVSQQRKGIGRVLPEARLRDHRSNARCEWTRQARYPYGQISCEIGI